MPLYRLTRHVIYRPGCQQTEEVWGIDRPATGLTTLTAPRFTDEDDPLRKDNCCVRLLAFPWGDFVPWEQMFEWLSLAETAGYTVVSGFEKINPYSTIVLRGPA